MELYTIGSLLSKLLGCQVCNTSRAGAGPTLLGPLVLEMVLGRVETQLRNIAGIRGLTIVRGAEMVETSEEPWSSGRLRIIGRNSVFGSVKDRSNNRRRRRRALTGSGGGQEEGRVGGRAHVTVTQYAAILDKSSITNTRRKGPLSAVRSSWIMQQHWC